MKRFGCPSDTLPRVHRLLTLECLICAVPIEAYPLRPRKKHQLGVPSLSSYASASWSIDDDRVIYDRIDEEIPVRKYLFIGFERSGSVCIPVVPCIVLLHTLYTYQLLGINRYCWSWRGEVLTVEFLKVSFMYCMCSHSCLMSLKEMLALQFSALSLEKITRTHWNSWDGSPWFSPLIVVRGYKGPFRKDDARRRQNSRFIVPSLAT